MIDVSYTTTLHYSTYYTERNYKTTNYYYYNIGIEVKQTNNNEFLVSFIPHPQTSAREVRIVASFIERAKC